ncbi:hypothetical protein HKX48_007907 [Thoreauomyces humboldtii]|nr:hypothetical protein HKX48_007907 [Thoreauomyces humboldtii]
MTIVHLWLTYNRIPESIAVEESSPVSVLLDSILRAYPTLTLPFDHRLLLRFPNNRGVCPGWIIADDGVGGYRAVHVGPTTRAGTLLRTVFGDEYRGTVNPAEDAFVEVGSEELPSAIVTGAAHVHYDHDHHGQIPSGHEASMGELMVGFDALSVDARRGTSKNGDAMDC